MRWNVAEHLVNMELAEVGNTRPLGEIAGALRSNGLRAVSPNGVLGDPRTATARAGSALMDQLVQQLNKKYSNGEFFVFTNEHQCFILGNEKHSDFVVIKDLEEDTSIEIFHFDDRLNFQSKKVEDLIHTIETKITKPTICSFNLSISDINQIRFMSKDSTHLFFTTKNNQIIVGFIDYRDIEQESDIYETNKFTKHSFQKIVTTESFLKFCVVDNYLVNISQNDFVSFESIKKSYL